MFTGDLPGSLEISDIPIPKDEILGAGFLLNEY